MATLYMDIKCPNLEKKIKEGCTLCITRNGPHSMLSRLETANGNLLVSVSYYSLKKILSETEFQLTDKLGFHMPNFNSSEKYPLEKFILKGGIVTINSNGGVFKGNLFDGDQNILAIRESKTLANIFPNLELEAYKRI